MTEYAKIMLDKKIKLHLDKVFTQLQPQPVRTFREFAEQEIILPDGGPRGGLKFRTDFMPWNGLVLDAFTLGLFIHYFGAGPVQGGKTFTFLQIPTAYHLFETRENVIMGCPDIDMGQSIYEERILPVIEKTRYKEFLPVRGAGSRGGKAKAIKFRHGPILRFMGAGGGDEQRSSHTSRVVVLTEIDKMDEAGEKSRETDPVSQIISRTRAFGQRARVYAECTMSIEEGRINREINKKGTGTRIFVPCPHCKNYVTPTRENFGGYQNAGDVEQAKENAHWTCYECGTMWSEKDRQTAIRTPKLVHKTQTIDKNGMVHGDPPKTDTFGFAWNSMFSNLTDMRDIAADEYNAFKSELQADVKKLHQFTWVIPFKDDSFNVSGLTRDLIFSKITKIPKGVVPDNTQLMVTFIDVGLYLCWYVTIAFTEYAQGQVIDYGPIEVPQDRKPSEIKIFLALTAFREEVLNYGWATNSGGKRKSDLVLVDSGWKPKIVYQYVIESGQGRYLSTKGIGTARNQDAWRPPKKKNKDVLIGKNWFISRQAGGIRLVNLNSDYWKERVHEGFGSAPGSPGSLGLYDQEERDHLTFARSILAEEQKYEFVPGKGERVYWDQKSNHNHYLDCTAGCLAGAELKGLNMETRTRKTATRTEPPMQKNESSGGNNWQIGRTT